MLSVRTCYYLYILTFIKVVLVHYNVDYVIYSTVPLTSKIANTYVLTEILCQLKLFNKMTINNTLYKFRTFKF